MEPPTLQVRRCPCEVSCNSFIQKILPLDSHKTKESVIMTDSVSVFEVSDSVIVNFVIVLCYD